MPDSRTPAANGTQAAAAPPAQAASGAVAAPGAATAPEPGTAVAAQAGLRAQAADAPAVPLWRWLAWAVLLIVIDQLTKQYFDTRLAYGERWNLLPFFDFTLLYNPGAAFSFLASGQGWQRWLFTGIAIGATVLILVMLRRHAQQTLFCTALATILGGAIGNLIDRLLHGHVVDFLLFYWNQWHFPAFNVADIAITCGAALLILDEILRMRRERRQRSSNA